MKLIHYRNRGRIDDEASVRRLGASRRCTACCSVVPSGRGTLLARLCRHGGVVIESAQGITWRLLAACLLSKRGWIVEGLGAARGSPLGWGGGFWLRGS